MNTLDYYIKIVKNILINFKCGMTNTYKPFLKLVPKDGKY